MTTQAGGRTFLTHASETTEPRTLNRSPTRLGIKNQLLFSPKPWVQSRPSWLTAAPTA